MPPPHGFEHEEHEHPSREVPDHVERVGDHRQGQAGEIDNIVDEHLGEAGEGQDRQHDQHPPPGQSVLVPGIPFRCLAGPLPIGLQHEAAEPGEKEQRKNDGQSGAGDLEQGLIADRHFDQVAHVPRQGQIPGGRHQIARGINEIPVEHGRGKRLIHHREVADFLIHLRDRRHGVCGEQVIVIAGVVADLGGQGDRSVARLSPGRWLLTALPAGRHPSAPPAAAWASRITWDRRRLRRFPRISESENTRHVGSGAAGWHTLFQVSLGAVRSGWPSCWHHQWR